MNNFILTIGRYSLITLLLSFSVHSSAFGTLLSSPQERAKLDRQRQGKELMSVSVEKTIPSPALKSVSFEGVVTRQSGPGSVWLNGQLFDKPPASQTLSTRQGETGVEVKLQTSEHPVWLKPGQLLDVDSGEFSDTYLGGRSTKRSEQTIEDQPNVSSGAQ